MDCIFKDWTFVDILKTGADEPGNRKNTEPGPEKRNMEMVRNRSTEKWGSSWKGRRDINYVGGILTGTIPQPY